MSLSDDERKAIVTIKTTKAEKAYSEMLTNYNLGLYSTAANRLYYSLFYATSALLVNDGFEAHTHSGNLSILNLHYIRTGKIDKSFGKLVRDVFRLRQESDYDDFFSIDKEDLDEYIAPSKQYIELIKDLL